MEVIFISESSGQPFNINVINIHNSSPVATFKGSVSQSNSLCHIRDDYVLSSIPNKAVINIYDMNRKGQQPQKAVVPGVVKALATSETGHYLAAGIENKIFIWSTYNGDLINILNRHYQDVTCLAFTHDCSMLISAGKDGLVCAWDMANLMDISTLSYSNSLTPIGCWASHSLAVTGLKCSLVGGYFSRVYSSSLDRTVKVYDLSQCQILLTLVFDAGVTAISIDPSESILCVGLYNGSIYNVDLCAQSVIVSNTQDSSINIDQHNSIVFKGHAKPLTCMDFNVDGSILVSGSADGTLRIWDVTSGQCLRSYSYKGGVTNIAVMLAPSSLTATNHKPSFSFPRLSRVINDSGDADKNISKVCVLGGQENKHNLGDTNALIEMCCHAPTVENLIDKDELEVEKLRKENKKLYQFAIQHVGNVENDS